MKLTGTSKALSYFTDTMALGLAVTGGVLGGILIALVAGYLIMKR